MSDVAQVGERPTAGSLEAKLKELKKERHRRSRWFRSINVGLVTWGLSGFVLSFFVPTSGWTMACNGFTVGMAIVALLMERSTLKVMDDWTDDSIRWSELQDRTMERWAHSTAQAEEIIGRYAKVFDDIIAESRRIHAVPALKRDERSN